MTELSTKDFVFALRNFLEEHRNPENAKAMKAYMKGKFEFFGIKIPMQRKLMKEFYAEYGHPTQEQVEPIVKALWKEPERELHIIAQEIAGKYMKKAKPEVIKLYEWMITHNSWWDTVDYIAIWLVGTLFKNYPEMIEPQVVKWMDSGNFWLQRTCLLFQRDYKENTNEELLFSLCTRLADEKEFFIRKAIGWILREYGKTSPETVVAFVNKTELSALSKKEALRRINL